MSDRAATTRYPLYWGRTLDERPVHYTEFHNRLRSILKGEYERPEDWAKTHIDVKENEEGAKLTLRLCKAYARLYAVSEREGPAVHASVEDSGLSIVRGGNEKVYNLMVKALSTYKRNHRASVLSINLIFASSFVLALGGENTEDSLAKIAIKDDGKGRSIGDNAVPFNSWLHFASLIMVSPLLLAIGDSFVAKTKKLTWPAIESAQSWVAKHVICHRNVQLFYDIENFLWETILTISQACLLCQNAEAVTGCINEAVRRISDLATRSEAAPTALAMFEELQLTGHKRRMNGDDSPRPPKRAALEEGVTSREMDIDPPVSGRLLCADQTPGVANPDLQSVAQDASFAHANDGSSTGMDSVIVPEPPLEPTIEQIMARVSHAEPQISVPSGVLGQKDVAPSGNHSNAVSMVSSSTPATPQDPAPSDDEDVAAGDNDDDSSTLETSSISASPPDLAPCDEIAKEETTNSGRRDISPNVPSLSPAVSTRLTAMAEMKKCNGNESAKQKPKTEPHKSAQESEILQLTSLPEDWVHSRHVGTEVSFFDGDLAHTAHFFGQHVINHLKMLSNHSDMRKPWDGNQDSLPEEAKGRVYQCSPGVRWLTNKQEFNLNLRGFLKEHSTSVMVLRGALDCDETFEDILLSTWTPQTQVDVQVPGFARDNGSTGLRHYSMTLEDFIRFSKDKDAQGMNLLSGTSSERGEYLRTICNTFTNWNSAWISTKGRFDLAVDELPWTHFNFVISAHPGAWSDVHVDASGLGTTCAIKAGTKLWFLLYRSREQLEQDSHVANPKEQLELTWAEWRVVPLVLRAGDIIVLPPGQAHAVATTERSVATGCHLLAEETLLGTLAEAMVQNLQPDNSNANHNHATMAVGDRLALHHISWSFDALNKHLHGEYVDIATVRPPESLKDDDSLRRLATYLIWVLCGEAVFMRRHHPKKASHLIQDDLRYDENAGASKQHEIAVAIVKRFMRWWNAVGWTLAVNEQCAAENERPRLSNFICTLLPQGLPPQVRQGIFNLAQGS